MRYLFLVLSNVYKGLVIKLGDGIVDLLIIKKNTKKKITKQFVYIYLFSKKLGSCINYRNHV